MIHDGYTIQESGFFVRPLSHQLVDRIELLIERGEWDEVDAILWRSPWFLGDIDELSDSVRDQLLKLMISFDLSDSQNNLIEGLVIKLTRPFLDRRSCDLCKQYLFDTDTDRPSMRGSEPILRESHFVLACDTHEGCPKGHHSNPVKLSKINEQAWQHFLDWRVVGLTDTQRACPVLRSNWSIMQNLVEQYGIPQVLVEANQRTDLKKSLTDDG